MTRLGRASAPGAAPVDAAGAWQARGMTSPAQREDRPAPDLQALRQLLDDLHRQVGAAVADLDATLDAPPDAPLDARRSATPTYSRPAPVPPRRMEQMTRTPEPTADLDDLVDLLVPRLLEQLVPALRDASREPRPSA